MSTIIEKINQLRALSRSSNINEATAAALAADKLIAKYRISEAELQLSNNLTDFPVKCDPDTLYESGRVIPWKRDLAASLANHYGCFIFNDVTHSNSGRKISRYRLVGIETDIAIVRYMFAWLVTEIERLSRSHCVSKGSVYANSYCQGVVFGIKTQLDKLKKEQRFSANQNGHTSTALQCLDNRVTKAESVARMQYKLRTVNPTTHSKINIRAYNLGIERGKSIHLGKVIGENYKMLK
jgi:hypothetical protein